MLKQSEEEAFEHLDRRSEKEAEGEKKRVEEG